MELGQIASIFNGSTPSTNNEDYWNGDIIWITPKDLSDQNQKYILKGERTITQKALSNTKLLPEGTVLLSSRAPIGLLSIASTKLVTNQGFKNIVVNTDILHNEFLYYYLKLKKNELNNLGSGTTFKEISKSTLEKYKIKLPDLPTQKSIAKVLSDLDAKIELNNRINRELEAMAKTLYDYWFVQFDFPFDFAQDKPNEQGKPYKSSGGKMVYNKELKREIPEGWEVYFLSSILKHNYSSISKNESFHKIEYLDTSSLTKNIIEETQSLNLTNDKIPSRARRVVEMNDILYSTVRPNLCHYGLIKHPKKNMIASTGFVQLSSKKDWISNDLIYTHLTSSWVSVRLHQIAALSVSAYPSISPNDILELNIALPKKDKNLEFINSYLDTIYSKISLNQNENQQLSSLRDWLLPMLMNGQVTVRQAHGNAVKEAEESLSMAAEPSVEYKKG